MTQFKTQFNSNSSLKII